MVRQRWRLTPAAAGDDGREGGSIVGGGGGGSGTHGRGGRCRTIFVKATILLPILEGAFVDANDPLLAPWSVPRGQQSPQGSALQDVHLWRF